MTRAYNNDQREEMPWALQEYSTLITVPMISRKESGQ